MEIIAENRCFGGRQLRFRHGSDALDCDMHFSLYLPPDQPKPPVIYWLSGLTCTDENFVQKAGAQQFAAKHGVAIVAPDTSPRGEGVPDDPEGAWDFGLGAGFYVNATQAPYAAHYQMYDYVTHELPALLTGSGLVDTRRSSIMGHSMGGHGALVVALRNPESFRAVSAFAPICAPTQVPWGEKAFSNYLGDNRERWRQYDACELVGRCEKRLDIRVDQGGDDVFLAEQLKPELLEDACKAANHTLELHMREGYDHSYFFIASFIGEHVAWHAERLG